jgi:hypothetical protein
MCQQETHALQQLAALSQVRDPRPEIDRTSKNSPFAGVIDRAEDQHQRREDDEVLDRVVVREHQTCGPFRMWLVVA